MIDTDKYPDGPDDERLMHFSKEELRLIVYAYGCEIRGLKHDSTYTDAYTLAEVKRLRKGIKELAERWTNSTVAKPSTLLVLAVNELKELIE